jgi:hypothetical protein
MRVFGLEGGGNAIAGCYPAKDIEIDFSGTHCLYEAEWKTIAASTNGEVISVEWSTAKESNILYFGVERSADGRNFEEIGQAQPINAGNFVQEYTFQDLNPLLGRNFYRIVDHSQNGETSFSPIAEAFFGSAEQFQIISVGPNPLADRLMLNFIAEKEMQVQIELTDIGGNLVFKYKIAAEAGTNLLEFETSQMAAGTYFLRMQTQGLSQTRKLIKR